MLRVTKLTDYATVVLTALAARPARVHSAAELAERARLELPTVSKVLKPLAQAGLVDGFRGASGGYRLARARRPDQPDRDRRGDRRPAGHDRMQRRARHLRASSTHCGVRANWRRINDVVADALRGISLAEMLPAAAPSPQSHPACNWRGA